MKFVILLILIFTSLLILIFISTMFESNSSYNEIYQKFRKQDFVDNFSYQEMNNNASSINIGFLIMGTGKYIKLVDQLIESMEKYFCVKEKNANFLVNYLIFTDNSSFVPPIDSKNKLRGYTILYQTKLGWPLDTLLRFNIILSNNIKYASFDYLYWIDADMRFVDFVCEDLLGDLVGTQHPHYYRRHFYYSFFFCFK